jgi:hypothetical protein
VSVFVSVSRLSVTVTVLTICLRRQRLAPILASGWRQAIQYAEKKPTYRLSGGPGLLNSPYVLFLLPIYVASRRVPNRLPLPNSFGSDQCALYDELAGPH